jgi:hypothetical protein
VHRRLKILPSFGTGAREGSRIAIASDPLPALAAGWLRGEVFLARFRPCPRTRLMRRRVGTSVFYRRFEAKLWPIPLAPLQYGRLPGGCPGTIAPGQGRLTAALLPDRLKEAQRTSGGRQAISSSGTVFTFC